MEDVLRWSLLVVGSCVIAGVLAHGLWVSRKNSQKSGEDSHNRAGDKGKQEYQPGHWSVDPESAASVETELEGFNSVDETVVEVEIDVE